MYKLKVKQYGQWVDFKKTSDSKEPAKFNSLKEANKAKSQRVKMFGPIYKVVKL